MTVHPRKLARDYIADILLNPVVNDPEVLYRRVAADELTEELKDSLAEALSNVIGEFAQQARRLYAFHCLDCKTQDLPFYSVASEVWREALLAREAEELKAWREAGRQGKMPHRWLCFPCLETRLGRPLTLEDFPAHIPANFPIHLGYAIAQSAAK